jgi:hypothetical protein
MKLELSPEELAATADPVLMRVAVTIATQLAKTAEAMATAAANGYMDKAAAMEYVGLKSERALENWMRPVREGGRGMPHMKIGETVKFKRDRIDAWMLTLEKNAPVVVHLEAVA